MIIRIWATILTLDRLSSAAKSPCAKQCFFKFASYKQDIMKPEMMSSEQQL